MLQSLSIKFFCLCSIIFSLSPNIYADVEPLASYNPRKISAGVEPIPGRVSWAPDGEKIAYISNGLHIYSIKTRESSPVNIGGPYYIAWGKSDELFVLYLQEGRKALCIVDTSSMMLKKVPLGIEPNAVFPVKENGGLLIFSERISAHPLWSDYNFELALFEPKTGSAKKIYETTMNLPVRNARPDDLRGIIHPEINPFDFTAMVMEFVKPPVVRPYAKIVVVDYVTGKSNVAGQIDRRGISTPGSWSPDGRKFAFPDDGGRLQIYNMNNGEITDGGQDIRGRRPSWNPRGSQIYFGGFVITPGIKEKEMLIPDGEASLSVWSPDGTAMALTGRDGLWLLENFRPSFLPTERGVNLEIKTKLLLLKELLNDKLITESDYEARFGRLIKEEWGVQ